MADDRVRATTVINAPAEAIFAVLADPAKHAGIDGTGWVGEAVDRDPLTAAGQVFRMSMYHPNHPDGAYQMANRVQAFHAPSTVTVGTPMHCPTGSASRGWRSRRCE